MLFVIAGFLWYPIPGNASEPLRIVAIGDSLISGYGLRPEFGFTSQLETALKDKGCSVRIINSGISGDTTDGGVARIDWVLSDPYSGVILLLGQNDAFRAIPVENVRRNLERIIENIQSRNIPILFVGALAPRNLGADYYQSFDTIYPELAKQYELLFYPFFLEGVATNPAMNQRDGIHPNEDGVGLIVSQMLPYVGQLITSIQANSPDDQGGEAGDCSI